MSGKTELSCRMYAIPERRSFSLGERRVTSSRGDAGESVDGMEDGGLARAVGADQAERLPRGDRQIDAVEDLHLPVTRVQAGDLQQRLLHLSGPRDRRR
jgi:hypothetical protein